LGILVVEYSTTTNTHPEGVGFGVPKHPLNEEFRAHPRMLAHHLTGSGYALKVRVSIACAS